MVQHQLYRQEMDHMCGFLAITTRQFDCMIYHGLSLQYFHIPTLCSGDTSTGKTTL